MFVKNFHSVSKSVDYMQSIEDIYFLILQIKFMVFNKNYIFNPLHMDNEK